MGWLRRCARAADSNGQAAPADPPVWPHWSSRPGLGPQGEVARPAGRTQRAPGAAADRRRKEMRQALRGGKALRSLGGLAEPLLAAA